jgi:hypothetical protein
MQERIHLLNGETVETEVTGRSLDGETGYAFVVPPGGTYVTFEAYILAGSEVQVRRAGDGCWQEVREVR